MSTKSENVLSDRYEVKKKLGEGGMGVVYLAHDLRLGDDVVIKMPRAAAAAEPGFAERFTREIRALVKLTHPHVVAIRDVGTHGKKPFAVMNFLAGGSLEEKGMPTPPAALATWLRAIADALDFVHAQGYLHRDVKPANILFNAHGHAFLSDFGIAKVLADGQADKPSEQLTGAGLVIGTAEYLAPELIMGDKLDGRADQYALAITVYEVLSGGVPFQGATPSATMVLQTTAGLPDLRAVAPGVGNELAYVIERGLCKDPAGRYDSCAEFAAAVLTAAGSAETGTVPVTRSDRAAGPKTGPRGTSLQAAPPTGTPARPLVTPTRLEAAPPRAVSSTRIESAPTPSQPGPPPTPLKAIPLPPKSPKPRQVEVEPEPEPEPPRRSSGVVWAVLVCLVALVGGGGTLAYFLTKSDTGSNSKRLGRDWFTFEPIESKSVQGVETITVKVKVKRSKHQGPIDITVRDLPAGVKARSCRIEAGVSEAALTLDSEDNATVGTTTVKVEGAVEGDKEEATFVLTVRGGPRLVLRPEAGGPYRVEAGKPTTIRVTVERHNCEKEVVLLTIDRSKGGVSPLNARLLTSKLKPEENSFVVVVNASPRFGGKGKAKAEAETHEVVIGAVLASRQAPTSLTLKFEVGR